MKQVFTLKEKENPLHTATFALLIKNCKIRALHHIKGDGPSKVNCNNNKDGFFCPC